jgi:hypothetical protein
MQIKQFVAAILPQKHPHISVLPVQMDVIRPFLRRVARWAPSGKAGEEAKRNASLVCHARRSQDRERGLGEYPHQIVVDDRRAHAEAPATLAGDDGTKARAKHFLRATWEVVPMTAIKIAAGRSRGEEAIVVGEPVGLENISAMASAAREYRRRKQELIELKTASPDDSDALQRATERCEQARLAVKQAIGI